MWDESLTQIYLHSIETFTWNIHHETFTMKHSPFRIFKNRRLEGLREVHFPKKPFFSTSGNLRFLDNILFQRASVSWSNTSFPVSTNSVPTSFYWRWLAKRRNLCRSFPFSWRESVQWLRVVLWVKRSNPSKPVFVQCVQKNWSGSENWSFLRVFEWNFRPKNWKKTKNKISLQKSQKWPNWDFEPKILNVL